MSRFCTLASSSKGNSVYVSGGGTAVLVDCGISYRRLKASFEGMGAALSQLRGVIVTHEHSDHISGLAGLLKSHDIPLYGSEETLRHLCAHDLIPRSATVIPLTEAAVIGDICVSPFDTPHDAVHSIGMRFSMPDGRTLAIATDLGHITETVRGCLSGCDLVFLEANYDPGMLICSRYPYKTKQRIKGEYGHLANEDCAGEIARLAASGSTRFVLGHLSEQNNLPVLAAQTARAALAMAGLREYTDYILSVAPAAMPHELVVF